MQSIDALIKDAKVLIEQASDLKALNQIRVDYLGKKGPVTALLKTLGGLSEAERPLMGQKVNEARDSITQLIDTKVAFLESAQLQNELSKNTLDVTLPGRSTGVGGAHPITRTLERVETLFMKAGFDIATGPEVETEFYNFEALNIPAHHPARAMADTFYFPDGRLLRTHTSTVQIRAMEQRKPPIQLISTGRVYRCDSDVTHTPMFHQIEGLVVTDSVTFADLKAIISNFLQVFFEVDDLKTRFRASYFPFTEPSAEVDVACVKCEGEGGCRICKDTGWLEVLGCGMVHPSVLKAVGIDPEIYTGFAFGMGAERLAMLRYQVSDIRAYYENDLQFLKAFSGA